MFSGPQKIQLFLSGIAMGLLLLLLAACDNFPKEDFSSVPPRKEPQVNLVQHAHIIEFDVGSDRLRSTEQEKIDVFLSKIRISDGDSVHIINGVSKPGANKEKAQALRKRRLAIVKAYLDFKRVKVNGLVSSFGVTPVSAHKAQILVRRYVVTLPGCPNWSKHPGHDYFNHVSSNWGCATATNLGLMVANPGDLITGQPLEPADPYYSTVLMERFREGTKVPLPINGESLGREIKKSGGGGGSSSGGSGDSGGSGLGGGLGGGEK